MNKAEYHVHLVSTNRLREFCGVHSWNMNGTRCRDGVKVLSFPSSLVFFLAVVLPVTSIREILKKPEVETQAHSSVQLTAP